jgi:hypothetical protein
MKLTWSGTLWSVSAESKTDMEVQGCRLLKSLAGDNKKL